MLDKCDVHCFPWQTLIYGVDYTLRKLLPKRIEYVHQKMLFTERDNNNNNNNNNKDFY